MRCARSLDHFIVLVLLFFNDNLTLDLLDAGNNLSLCGLCLQCSFLRCYITALTSCTFGLFDRVGLRLQRLQTALVDLGAEMCLHCGVVDEILCTMDAVELSETGLVEIHLLVDELLWLFLNVFVDLEGNQGIGLKFVSTQNKNPRT